MATHDPALYRFPLWADILLYTTLLTAYYVYARYSLHFTRIVPSG